MAALLIPQRSPNPKAHGTLMKVKDKQEAITTVLTARSCLSFAVLQPLLQET